jgi:DNA-binding GntR family transcriptional regulator
MAKRGNDRTLAAEDALFPMRRISASKSEGAQKAGSKIGARMAPLIQQAAPLRNRIISALRGAIETGILIPGQRLIEKDLCEQLNVSRTSLREALREIQAEGVLQYNSSRGLSVAEISIADAQNIYRIRAVLEALAVEQFVERADNAQIKDLGEESKRLQQAYRSGVLENILLAKRSFYDRICSGAKNQIAFDMINRLILRTSSLRRRSLIRKERHRQSIKEIRALTSAIQQRDVERAREAAIEHVNNSARSALK